MKSRLLIHCLITCVLFSGCSFDKSELENDYGNNSTSYESYWTANTTNSSDEDFGGIIYEDNSSTFMTDESKTDMFFANNSEDIIQNDFEQIQGLCTKVCSVLAEISQGKETELLTEYVVNSDLEIYLNYEFSNSLIQLDDSNSMSFNITSCEIDKEFAFVTGVYKNSSSSYGPYIFVIENSEGKLIVNDLICADMDSADYTYRSEIVNLPKADFWKDPANYSEILNMINEQEQLIVSPQS